MATVSVWDSDGPSIRQLLTSSRLVVPIVRQSMQRQIVEVVEGIVDGGARKLVEETGMFPNEGIFCDTSKAKGVELQLFLDGDPKAHFGELLMEVLGTVRRRPIENLYVPIWRLDPGVQEGTQAGFIRDEVAAPLTRYAALHAGSSRFKQLVFLIPARSKEAFTVTRERCKRVAQYLGGYDFSAI